MNKYLYIDVLLKQRARVQLTDKKKKAGRKRKKKRAAIYLLLCRNIWKVFEGSACELGAMGKNWTPIPPSPTEDR